MKWNRSVGLNIIGAVILLVGLGSAVFLYQRGEVDVNDIYSYETEGDATYSLGPENSKRYLRDLEMYGGKAGILADELRRWLLRLWRGESAAYIVAILSILISTLFFYAAGQTRGHR